MRYDRKYPKLKHFPEELSWAWSRYIDEIHIDADEALEILWSASGVMRDETPEQVIRNYFRLDLSVLPFRTMCVLWAYLDMQRTDGLRLLAPTRTVIERAEQAEIVGWKPPRGKWGMEQVMDANRRLQQFGLLDEFIPGTPGKPTEWDRYYQAKGEGRDATIVKLCRFPEQPTLRVRGHARPSLWSVHLASFSVSSSDITPITTRTPPKNHENGGGYYGRAVCQLDEGLRVLTMEDLRTWE